jgi:hypothetical protein
MSLIHWRVFAIFQPAMNSKRGKVVKTIIVTP